MDSHSLPFWRPGAPPSQDLLTFETTTTPVSALRDNFLHTVETSRGIVIIADEAGSGASDALPLYLDAAGWSKGGRSICVTHPTRSGTAVAAEKATNTLCGGAALGGIVGLAEPFDERSSPRSTRLLFCTENAVMASVARDATLSRFCAIVVCGAEGRRANTDILLGLLRHSHTLRPDLRIIIIVTGAPREVLEILRFFERKEEEENDDAVNSMAIPPPSSILIRGGEVEEKEEEEEEARQLAAALTSRRQRAGKNLSHLPPPPQPLPPPPLPSSSVTTLLELPDAVEAIEFIDDTAGITKADVEELEETGGCGEGEVDDGGGIEKSKTSQGIIFTSATDIIDESSKGGEEKHHHHHRSSHHRRRRRGRTHEEKRTRSRSRSRSHSPQTAVSSSHVALLPPLPPHVTLLSTDTVVPVPARVKVSRWSTPDVVTATTTPTVPIVSSLQSLPPPPLIRGFLQFPLPGMPLPPPIPTMLPPLPPPPPTQILVLAAPPPSTSSSSSSVALLIIGGSRYPVSIYHSNIPVKDVVTAAATSARTLASQITTKSGSSASLCGDILVFLSNEDLVMDCVNILRENDNGNEEESDDGGGGGRRGSRFDVRALFEATAAREALVPRVSGTNVRIFVTTDAGAVAAGDVALAHVCSVVDSGWTQGQAFDIGAGLSVCIRMSIDNVGANTRASYAGLHGIGGIVLRLYDTETARTLPLLRRAELTRSDATPTFLALLNAGIKNVARVPLPAFPRSNNAAASLEFLLGIGAVDARGTLTNPRGTAIASLSSLLSPPVAATLLRAAELNCACIGVLWVALTLARSRGAPSVIAKSTVARDLAAASCGTREGDALTQVNALLAWRTARGKGGGGAGAGWATTRGLSARGLLAADEARRDIIVALRTVVVSASGHAPREWITAVTEVESDDGSSSFSSRITNDPEMCSRLARAISNGFFSSIARLLPGGSRGGGGSYETVRGGIRAVLSPDSFLSRVAPLPPFVVYTQAARGGRGVRGEIVMCDVTAISPAWLLTDIPLIFTTAGGWDGADRLEGVAAEAGLAEAKAVEEGRRKAGIVSSATLPTPLVAAVPMRYKSAAERRREAAEIAAAAEKTLNAAKIVAAEVANVTAVESEIGRARAEAGVAPRALPMSVSSFLASAFEGGALL